MAATTTVGVCAGTGTGSALRQALQSVLGDIQRAQTAQRKQFGGQKGERIVREIDARYGAECNVFQLRIDSQLWVAVLNGADQPGDSAIVECSCYTPFLFKSQPSDSL